MNLSREKQFLSLGVLMVFVDIWLCRLSSKMHAQMTTYRMWRLVIVLAFQKCNNARKYHNVFSACSKNPAHFESGTADDANRPHIVTYIVIFILFVYIYA